MKIRSARSVRQEPSPRGFHTLAKFNLAATEDITIYDCTIVRAPDGNLLVYGPAGRSTNQILSLSPRARMAVIEMVLEAVGLDTHEQLAA